MHGQRPFLPIHTQGYIDGNPLSENLGHTGLYIAIYRQEVNEVEVL